jgi:transcription elongation factor Elf1
MTTIEYHLNQNELPPCRFCGSDKVYTGTYDKRDGDTFDIFGITACTNCGFSVKSIQPKNISIYNRLDVPYQLWETVKKESREFWIKRNEKHNPFIENK